MELQNLQTNKPGSRKGNYRVGKIKKNNMSVSEFNTKNCESISIQFSISNVNALIPGITRVYIDTPNAYSTSKPIFETPSLNTDASIPKTNKFKHYKGLLYFETFLSYKNIADQSKEEILKIVKKTILNYCIYDFCTDNYEIFSSADLIDLIPSKNLVYITKKIDLI